MGRPSYAFPLPALVVFVHARATNVRGYLDAFGAASNSTRTGVRGTGIESDQQCVRRFRLFGQLPGRNKLKGRGGQSIEFPACDGNHGDHRFACRRDPSRIELVAIDAGNPIMFVIFFPRTAKKTPATGGGE